MLPGVLIRTRKRDTALVVLAPLHWLPVNSSSPPPSSSLLLPLHLHHIRCIFLPEPVSCSLILSDDDSRRGPSGCSCWPGGNKVRIYVSECPYEGMRMHLALYLLSLQRYLHLWSKHTFTHYIINISYDVVVLRTCGIHAHPSP